MELAESASLAYPSQAKEMYTSLRDAPTAPPDASYTGLAFMPSMSLIPSAVDFFFFLAPVVKDV